MRKAMVVGVRDFLTLPTSAEELRSTIINVRHVEHARRASTATPTSAKPLGTVVTVAGFKGGIGKSTIASNLSVALAQQTHQHVALIDLDLQFGDAAVMLDMIPTTTIEDVVKDIEGLDPQLLQSHMTVHASRVSLLPAPYSPEAADSISDEAVAQVLELLASTNDFLVIDTAPHLDGLSVAAMEISTIILLVVVPEIPCLRRTRAALALMQTWGYSQDKVKLVVNRTGRRDSVSRAEIERVLNYTVFAEIPDDRAVAQGISVGAPAAMSSPKSAGGSALNDLGRKLSGSTRQRTALSAFKRNSPTQFRQRRAMETAARSAAAEDARPVIFDDLPVVNGVAPKASAEPPVAASPWMTVSDVSESSFHRLDSLGDPEFLSTSTGLQGSVTSSFGNWPTSKGQE
jgi:pilus assembly protein CpaE